MRHILNAIFMIGACLLVTGAVSAQTLSNCLTTPPPLSAKPGVGNLSLSRDGKTVVVAGGDGQIRFLDLNSGEVRRVIGAAHTNMIYNAILSHDETLMVSSSRDHTAKLWDVRSGRQLRQYTGFRCAVKTVAISPDQKLMAAAGNDGLLKLWDVKTGDELQSLVHVNSAKIDMSIYSIVFSRDSQRILAANGDGTISEWDVKSGKETKLWKAHDQISFRLLFSPDYRVLVSFGDSVVNVWDTSTWRKHLSLSMARGNGLVESSSTLAVSHNGKLIAASNIGLNAKQDAYVYVQTIIWDARTGEKLFTFQGHRFDIDGLSFTRDDRYLLTGSVDMTIKVWDLKTGQLSRTLNFSPAK